VDRILDLRMPAIDLDLTMHRQAPIFPDDEEMALGSTDHAFPH
jgi:hypothetical protein